MHINVAVVAIILYLEYQVVSNGKKRTKKVKAA